MPIREFKCLACEKEFELLLNHDEPEPTQCPDCGKEVEKLFPRKTTVQYKTIGFYKTDYQNVERQRSGERFGNKPKKD